MQTLTVQCTLCTVHNMYKLDLFTSNLIEWKKVLNYNENHFLRLKNAFTNVFQIFIQCTLCTVHNMYKLDLFTSQIEWKKVLNYNENHLLDQKMLSRMSFRFLFCMHLTHTLTQFQIHDYSNKLDRHTVFYRTNQHNFMPRQMQSKVRVALTLLRCA